jgi:hypothetical protein
MVAAGTMFFQQWTGINAVLYYAPQIFQGLGLTGNSISLLATGVVGYVAHSLAAREMDSHAYSSRLSPSPSPLIVRLFVVSSIVMFLATIPAVLYIDKIGRKPVLVSGAIWMAACHFVRLPSRLRASSFAKDLAC